MEEIILTGIKPTGKIHIGNYFGAVKPAIDLAKQQNAKAMFFIADYHALNYLKDKNKFSEYTFDLAATWLACGLDESNLFFYRQSDIPEIFEINWILSNVTPKGLMNRAHAYKSLAEENIKNGKEVDDGINMGLFNYPILMAADILSMKAKFVPVGEDQKQHVEITREIARIFNNLYGETFILPEEKINKNVGLVLGLDGRKMSKSYNNTIELFCSEEELRKKINKIVTDSSNPNDPKNTDCLIFKIFSLFANDNQRKEMEKRFKEGISWGDVKKITFQTANDYIKPMREKYMFYKNNPNKVEEILRKGCEEARNIAKIILNKVRQNIGKYNF